MKVVQECAPFRIVIEKGTDEGGEFALLLDQQYEWLFSGNR